MILLPDMFSGTRRMTNIGTGINIKNKSVVGQLIRPIRCSHEGPGFDCQIHEI